MCLELYRNHNTFESKAPAPGFLLFMKEITLQNQLWGWGCPEKKAQR